MNNHELEEEYAVLETALGNEIKTKIIGEHKYRFRNQYAIADVYDEEALKVQRDEILFRRNHGYDNVIINSGDEREGKTTWTTVMAKLVNNNFPVSNYAFSLDEFDTLIETANVGEQIIMDEAGYSIFALDFMKDFQRRLVKKLQVIGKRELILYLNLPHKQDLTKRLRDRRVSAWNYVFAKRLGGGKLERGYCELRLPDKSKFDQFIWWKLKYACRFPKVEGKFWDDYEEKKDIFIASVSSTENKKISLTSHTQKAIAQRNKLIKYVHYYQYMNQTEIAYYLGLTQGMVSNILKEKVDEEVLYGYSNNRKNRS